MPVLGELKAKVPVKIWATISEVESQALTQLRNTAMLPYVFHHVAAMPDVHLGSGATVGSVVAMKGAVIPAAVGVDIGCGMMALKLKLEPNRVLDKLAAIRAEIENNVPVGFNSNEDTTKSVKEWKGWDNFKKLTGVDTKRMSSKAASQLGSLGGGNHFIELCLDTNGDVWVMLHSGSRNIGKELAEHHIRSAKGMMAEYHQNMPDPNLAYLLEGTKEFNNYIFDLRWAQNYAAANREEMMSRVLAAVAKVVGLDKIPETEYSVNCHHNYVADEVHFGEKVLVTRKGAVRAQVGDIGIIPGSMGTKSYIVEGLGNPDSFNSCSHGAGRRFSRGEAKRRFSTKDIAEQLGDLESRRDDGIIDELPGAYKDIDHVMENQNDLVSIKFTLKAIMCVKG